MFKNYLYLFLVLLFSASCNQDDFKRREYQEVSVPAPVMQTNDDFSKNHPFLDKQKSLPSDSLTPMSSAQPELMASVADVSLIWATPKDWIEAPGSGMRVVTFNDLKNEIECSIVSLGGMAGGLEANVIRWLKQINIPDLPAVELKEFIDSQEEIILNENLKLKVINFSNLQTQENDDVQSMVASIIEISDKTIFIKMTGSKTSVLANLEKFKSLCKSLKFNP